MYALVGDERFCGCPRAAAGTATASFCDPFWRASAQGDDSSVVALARNDERRLVRRSERGVRGVTGGSDGGCGHGLVLASLSPVICSLCATRP